MALFGGRVSRFFGPPKSFRFENIRGVHNAAISGSRMHGTGIFVDGARGEFPGSWKLRNQEAYGPFRGSSFQVFRASGKFQIREPSRCALRPFLGIERTVPGFCGSSEGRVSRQLETQKPGSKWPFLGVEFPGF